jgi:hypothetical protein
MDIVFASPKGMLLIKFKRIILYQITNYLTTAWDSGILEKLVFPQLVKNFPAFCGKRKSSLSLARSIQTTTSKQLSFKIHLNIILPSTPMFSWWCLSFLGRDSSVTTATRYGAVRSGDQIPVGARSYAPVQKALVSTQPPIQWVPGLFPGDKMVGAWR